MSAVILPELGEGITKATVACWHNKPGDRVQEGDDLVELVTDKATFNVSAEKNGILKTILVPEGKEAAIGATLAVIE
jgi:pyruvate/2-oxoglutarate dehydrogenase complex dihydrolipoamide acyltransferase (E2) component